MGNEFAVQPELDQDFPRKLTHWTCPITGMTVPKTPEANLEYRLKVMELAEEDEDFRIDLYTACSQSLLYFVNAFVYTLRVFQPGEDGQSKQAAHAHIPMVTWGIQDRHLLWLEQRIDDGLDGLTDKSRDMGATWDHMALLVHRLLFRDSESHLVISRKEDAVDILDGQPKQYPFGPLADPGTLFGKIDYILSRLPEWMIPKMNRKKMHLVNLDNSSRIDGESANATAGSSDRRTSVTLDEMAKMKEGESIKRSTRDVTACRLVCSTPNGAGTAYSKWRMSGQIDVFILPWWEHPEKGKGRYTIKDEIGRWKIRSPWYDYEEQHRSPKEMAIEIDMDHVGSGDTFFEGVVIEEHRKMFAKPPLCTRHIAWRKSVPDSEIQNFIARRDLSGVIRGSGNHLRLWTKLINGRPDQRFSYTLACDISKGQGASNSTVSIMCNETREKIGEWANAATQPHTFARIVVAICLWVGGKNRYPLLIWENNGDPGLTFGDQVVRVYSYPHVYFHRESGTIAQKRGKRFGWRSDTESKAVALGQLRRAYAHGGFINHSDESLTETLSYVTYDGGGIGPAELVEESASARKAHGDRVIADALCLVAVGDAPKTKARRPAPPKASIGGRIAQWKRAKKDQRSKTRFNFADRGVR